MTTQLSFLKQETKEELKTFLTNFLDNFDTIQTSIDLVRILSDFSVKGKMLRGLLSMYSYEMYGGLDKKSALNLGASIEIVESALLIHDDCMDQDLIRRGGKSIYAHYISHGKHYGFSMALCAGDYLFFLVFKLLGEISTSEHTKSKLLNLFSSKLTQVVHGQMEDFYFGQSKEEPDIETILNIYKNKTSSYTFALPLISGALLAGANDREVAKLEELSILLGQIFQIHDDVIGIFQDEQTTGKSSGGDIRENKKTFLRALIFNKVDDKDKKILKKIFGTQPSEEDMKTIKRMAEESGAFEEVKQKLSDMHKKSLALINTLHISTEHKKNLNALVEYISTRSH